MATGVEEGISRTRRRTVTTALSAAIVLALLLAAAPALIAWAAPVGSTALVSTAADGSQANDLSYGPSPSSDGGLVAFTSYATDLLFGDINGTQDIFVKNTDTGAIVMASTSTADAAADSASRHPSISADGTHVAFESFAKNLIITDEGGSTSDVFVKRLSDGMVYRASSAADGTPADDHSEDPRLSADGRNVAFSTAAGNLVPGDTNALNDVFLKDLDTGAIERISVTSADAQSNQPSYVASLSADGRFVAFISREDLIAPDGGVFDQIFLRDRTAGTLYLVSSSAAGTAGGADSSGPSISSDGRYVAFWSSASNLVTGDSGVSEDVFIKDTLDGSIQRASLSSSEAAGDGSSMMPSLSADGGHVAFSSTSTNLVAGDTNGLEDVFIRDLRGGSIARASVDGSMGQADTGTGNSGAVLSPDGRFVTFSSDATDIVTPDTNGAQDIFIRDADLFAPTVAFASSARKAGAYIRRTISIPALATDGNSGVHAVSFYDGSTKKGEDLSSPYSYSLDTKLLTNGKHTVKLLSEDESGNLSSFATRMYRVDNYRPRTYTKSPKKTSVVKKGKYVRLYYKVKDPYTNFAKVTIKIKTLKGNTKKTIKVGWKKPGSFKYYRYKANLPKGTYRYFVYATDKAGNTQLNVAKKRLRIKAATHTSAPALAPSSTALAGRTIVLDAGHQRRGNPGLEPIGPGASTKKAKVTSGATGVATRIPEYKTVLAITKRIKTALEKQGATVVLTRSTHDVNIPNSKRAKMANAVPADLVIRIHADGNTNRSVKGISTLYPGANRWTGSIRTKSLAAAQRIHPAVLASTGRKDRGIKPRTDLTGFNWSTVPVVLVETGFLSSPTEDRLLNTAAEQERIAKGIATGATRFFAE